MGKRYMGKLDNQSVWITGGGTGIGAAAALTLAQAGAKVFVSGRRLEPLESIVQSIAKVGGKAHAVPLDVADADSVASAAAGIGQVDILVANAGLNVPNRSLGSLTSDD